MQQLFHPRRRLKRERQAKDTSLNITTILAWDDLCLAITTSSCSSPTTARGKLGLIKRVREAESARNGRSLTHSTSGAFTEDLFS